MISQLIRVKINLATANYGQGTVPAPVTDVAGIRAAFVCHWKGGKVPMTALHVGKSFCVRSDFFSLVGFPEGKI